MSQTDAILAMLRNSERGITAIDALEYVGCFRLAARIADLRAEGYDIETRTRTTTTHKHIAVYVLHENRQQEMSL